MVRIKKLLRLKKSTIVVKKYSTVIKFDNAIFAKKKILGAKNVLLLSFSSDYSVQLACRQCRNQAIEMGDVIMYLYLSNYQMGNITKRVIRPSLERTHNE